MLCPFAKREWMTLLAIGVLLSAAAAMLYWWWVVMAVIVVVAALLLFFRDPQRTIPSDRHVMVSPADGRVSSVHEVAHFEPFGGPATCVRVFLSVLDVHVNRSPCHARVASVTHRPGKHLNALNPQSADDNEANMILLHHPAHKRPVAAVRQVAGLLARTICCNAKPGQIIQRGQTIGIIKLGSTAELYVPAELEPKIAVKQGDHVTGGATILAHYSLIASADAPEDDVVQAASVSV